MGHPGPLGAVADSVFQRGVGPGLLDQTADTALQQGRALLRPVDHLGGLAVAGRRRGLRRGHPGAGGFGYLVVHLAGQLGAALAVFLH